MSDADDPKWLDDVARELRAVVRVRPSWRSRLVSEVASLPRPEQVRSIARVMHARSLTIRPVTAIAAALAFALIGAAVATTWLTRRGETTIAIGSSRTAGRAIGVPVAALTREVRFVLLAPHASRVSLVGDFNRWNPTSLPLVRDAAAGAWSLSVALPPGRHVYAFVVDGDLTADPTAPRAGEEDFGKPNSVVVVTGPAT